MDLLCWIIIGQAPEENGYQVHDYIDASEAAVRIRVELGLGSVTVIGLDLAFESGL